MSRLKNVTSGIIQRPLGLIIYGPGGVGKTTFASKAPNTIFADIERGTDKVEGVFRDRITSYQDLMDLISELEEGSHKYKSFALDSLDRLEPLVWQHVCKEYATKGASIKNIEAFGYGKGYVHAKEVWEKLILRFDALRDKGMNVLLIAHNQVRTFQDPINNVGYDRNIMKLHEKSTGCLQEWAEVMLFADFQTDVYTDDNKKTRAISEGERVMYTEKRASFDAKSRVALPFEMPVDFDNFMKEWNNAHGKKIDVQAKIESLLRQVNDPDIIKFTEKALKKKTSPAGLQKICERLELNVKGAA